MRRAAAIIPARGGSKGLPGKNLLPIGGLSLLARSILTAQTAQGVERVLVSTDSQAIASEARRFGAEVVRRPQSLASDTASSESAVLHAIETMSVEERPDLVVFLQCTSPFVLPSHVDDLLGAIEDGYDSAFLACEFHGFLWRSDGDGVAGVNHDHRQPRLRRQELDRQLLETGAGYAFVLNSFLESQSRFCGNVTPVEMLASRALEIDHLLDYQLACQASILLDANRHGPDEADPISLPFTKPPKILVLDFDGVFTDNRVLVAEDGTESVICDRGDGHAIADLAKRLPTVVLSTETNPVVAARCRKLGIDFVQGLGDRKVDALVGLLAEREIAPADAMFVGNDANDLECLQLVGAPVVVADAVAEVRVASKYILSARGGRGALRELVGILDANRTDSPETTRG